MEFNILKLSYNIYKSVKTSFPMQKIKLASSSTSLFFLIFSFLLSANIMSQTANLSEDFLEGLPPSVRDQIEVQNSVTEEKDLEDLFRSDTSIEKNKIILEKLKKELKALEQKISGSDEYGNSNKEITRYGEIFFQSLQSSFMPVNVPNLDSNYIVDVGDGFKLLLTGKISDELELMVERDGALVIPEFGKVFVAGKTLAEAEKLVSSFLEIKTVGVSAFLTLSKVRDIQVLMLGGVVSPGIFTISGGSSILSALNVAGGIAANGSFRKIDLKRGGETIDTIDLYDIFVFGNYNARNTLRSGDTIFVHPSSFIVPVTGGVNNEALFEILSGESLESAISFAGGFSEGFYGFDEVFIESVDLNQEEITNIKKNNLSSFLLKPRDSVQVPSFMNALKPMKQVTVEGMVKRPGKYYINEGETLSNLILRAGGYKENAYIFGGALFRESALEKEKTFARLNYSDTVNYIVSSIGKPNTNVDGSALDLLAEELRSSNFKGRIISDFSIASGKSKDQMKLMNDDLIVIPELQKVVYLFGDFKNPSNLKYNSKYGASDYIDLVGGLKKSAYKELLVIDPDGTTHLYKTNSLIFGDSSAIYPGSIIYAPRDIGKLSGVMYASAVSPILSSLALSLASLNSISD